MNLDLAKCLMHSRFSAKFSAKLKASIVFSYSDNDGPSRDKLEEQEKLTQWGSGLACCVTLGKCLALSESGPPLSQLE